MLLRFGPYVISRRPLSKKRLREIGVTQEFLDTYLEPFLNYLVNIRIEAPIHGIDMAKNPHWKPDLAVWERDANIKKLRRAAWYLRIPVGSICVGRSKRDGYYWPRNREEFKKTITQYVRRLKALARTKPFLLKCSDEIDILALRPRDFIRQERQIPLFAEFMEERQCNSIRPSAVI